MTLTTCAFCRAEFDVSLTSCPRCGAGADVRNTVDEGGWVEVPPVKDMAEIQFGRSHAQIEGLMVPVADVDLADGDSVYCTHDKLLWWDGKAKLTTKSSGMFKAMRTGMPLTLLEAHGPGRIGFSDNLPGEVVGMPLNPGETLVSRQHHMLLATGNMDYKGHWLDRWYEIEKSSANGETETERFHPFGAFETFTVTDGNPGLVLLHAQGNVFTRKLGAGEVVDVAPHSILAWTGGGDRPGLLIERKPWSIGRNHYLSARMQGPLTIWIQSGTMGKTQEHQHIHRYGPESYVIDI